MNHNMITILVFGLLFSPGSSIFLEEGDLLVRNARDASADFDEVTAQAGWSDSLMNWEDSWFFMEDRILSYNSTLDGRTDRTYLRNALENFQGKLRDDVLLLRSESTGDADPTAKDAAVSYGDMLEDGLRCQANGALDALDDYTCGVMSDATDPLDDVLFALLKGDQHMNLAAADPVMEDCEWQLAETEWDGTLTWIRANGVVNEAHEYVIDLVRRLGSLNVNQFGDTATACSYYLSGITRANNQLSSLTPEEQAFSTPKLNLLITESDEQLCGQ